MPGDRIRMISWAPLAAKLAAGGVTSMKDTAARLNVPMRSVSRYRGIGQIRIITADRFAVLLGYHPYEIWGDEWWEAEHVNDYDQYGRRRPA